ncbi:Glyoxylase, beta-lactamase superfamily II [Flavobacteriaceae bacterium MAR_2010_188]|nr:Glyoxylase, beta-lactamase superfamily II [Flavobacteriaceae bacterium MAR_2010_188]
MNIKQFEYKPLSHYSYAIVSEGKMAVIDPERDPSQYYQYAEDSGATIVAVFETHPHADFISSHLQILQETGATIYNSEKTGADYPHQSFDEGDTLQLGKIEISALNTPGHSPDSITIVAKDGNATALFTGDTIFIGDVGRPDLRESAGNLKSKRQDLAEAMYNTVTTKFKNLPDAALIFPAHGAGSLCGKSMSDANSSTLGNERMGNWAFKEQTKEEFVNVLLENQPFIPSYFGYDVEMNKTGAENLRKSISEIPFKLNSSIDDKNVIVDIRDEAIYKKGHVSGSFNIQATSANSKFETWLGAIVKPNEDFHIVIESSSDLEGILNRVSKIGYEKSLKSVITLNEAEIEKTDILDLDHFKNHPEEYTIIDIRNKSEVEEGKFFKNALSHPLNDLRNSFDEIPSAKPIVVHCAGGYRSAAGSSILENKFENTKVFDLGEAVKEFQD